MTLAKFIRDEPVVTAWTAAIFASAIIAIALLATWHLKKPRWLADKKQPRTYNSAVLWSISLSPLLLLAVILVTQMLFKKSRR